MFVSAWLVGGSLWTTKRKIIAIFLKNTWNELNSRKILQGLLKGQPILGEDEPKFYTQQPHRWKIACWKNLQVLLFNNRLCTCWA